MLRVSNRLIIFTRYPEPGKAKTRLIPSLGAEAAAHLHRQMTEQTLAEVNRLQRQPLPQWDSLTVQVWYTGGDDLQMQTWLGATLDYKSQPDGDLGDRLTAAVQTAVVSGARATVVIGTDCPDLTAEILATSFELLQHNDLVLGPATDGGYYLIGLRRFVPELFKSIAWSTECVFQQTLELATDLQLSLARLPVLTDVDRPEDLPIWEKAMAARAQVSAFGSN
jgi:rSAM/selenodomain-associated transferase 1